jgi:mRNA-degrading endonuclease RelE of RelBE toxin-antitoxin system
MPSSAENLDSGKITIYFTSAFKRNLRTLAKKYRHIHSDIQPIIEQLQKGQFVGNQVPHTGYTVYKVRVRNHDLQKGKRAGYRIVYYLQTGNNVILITIYSKLEQSDISANKIRQIISDYERMKKS